MTCNESEITRNILDKIRIIQESSTSRKNILKEEAEKKENDKNTKSKSIAITDDPKFGQNVLTNQINEFRSSVDSGAEFSKPEEGNVSESPLIYMPETKNLVFSGLIPRLNNLKWQFVLKTDTGNGCFLFADGLILNKENMQVIYKILGFYENWREQWNKEATDLEKMAEAIKEK